MRPGRTASLLLVLATLTGCGSGSGDADDVPTITTRPSTPASSTATPSSEPPSATTSSAAPTTSEPPTPPPSDDPTETAGPSPEPPTDQPVGPTTYRQALARIAVRSEVRTADRFSTPGDDVYCLLADDVIGPACELRRGFVKDEDVCGGAAEGVGRIETFEGEARPVCNTDTIREPGAPTIDPDGVVVRSDADTECVVEDIGVTCVDHAARTGFFLAPGEYHVF